MGGGGSRGLLETLSLTRLLLVLVLRTCRSATSVHVPRPLQGWRLARNTALPANLAPPSSTALDHEIAVITFGIRPPAIIITIIIAGPRTQL